MPPPGTAQRLRNAARCCRPGLAVATIGAAVGGADQNVAGLVIQGAGLGAQLVQTKYGRDPGAGSRRVRHEVHEARRLRPMGRRDASRGVRAALAGERLEAAELRRRIVRISPAVGRACREEQGPLPKRWVAAASSATASYAARLKPLLDMKPAYDKHDKALAAARKKDYAQARQLATEAATGVPKEGRFQQTLGEIALAEKDEKKAIGYYEKAISLDPDYFGSYLGAGVAQYRSGNKAKAEELLTRSSKLLPTAPAAFYLGELAKGRGETQKAMQLYQAAASSQSEVGQAAAGEFVKLDLPQNPGNYVAAAGQLDANGRVVLVVQNRAPVTLTDIRVTPVLVNAGGQVVSTGGTVRVNQPLEAGKQAAVDAGLGGLTQEQLRALRFKIEGARVVE